MQFPAQIRLDDVEPDGGRLAVDLHVPERSGNATKWDPGAGGNRALVFGMGALGTAAAPEEEVTLLAETAAVAFVTVESDDHLEARGRWSREIVRCNTCIRAALLWQR
jgi:hypothetical protein